MMRKMMVATALATMVPLLSGCLYYRLTQTYYQLCDERPRIVVEEANGGERVLVFDEPTLYDTDVECLMGAAPSRIEHTDVGKQWIYMAIPMGPERPEDQTITVTLSFDFAEGRHRLSRATLPMQLEQILSQRLIDQSIEAACNGQLDLITRTAQVDLAGIDRASLPDRSKVIGLYGPPNGEARSGDVLSWIYCVEGCGDPDDRRKTSRVGIVFDPLGRIEQASADYLQYSAYANFVEEQAVVAFRGSVAEIAWECGL